MKKNKNITTGTWAKDKAPMQVISDNAGKEKIHFEVPPSTAVSGEMKKSIQ